jgi:hypothetical protein
MSICCFIIILRPTFGGTRRKKCAFGAPPSPLQRNNGKISQLSATFSDLAAFPKGECRERGAASVDF